LNFPAYNYLVLNNKISFETHHSMVYYLLVAIITVSAIKIGFYSAVHKMLFNSNSKKDKPFTLVVMKLQIILNSNNFYPSF